MSQTKKGSLFESLVNVFVGIALSFLSNIIILHHFGVAISLKNNGLMTLYFTGISIARSYTLRRIFNKQRGISQ